MIYSDACGHFEDGLRANMEGRKKIVHQKKANMLKHEGTSFYLR